MINDFRFSPKADIRPRWTASCADHKLRAQARSERHRFVRLRQTRIVDDVIRVETLSLADRLRPHVSGKQERSIAS